MSGNTNAFLKIYSKPAVDISIFADELNGVTYKANYPVHTGDIMFEDVGLPSQDYYYSSESGSFSQTNAVPMPAIGWLFASAIPSIWLTRCKKLVLMDDLTVILDSANSAKFCPAD